MPEYSISRVDRPDWPKIPEIELSHTGWLDPCGVSAKAQLCHDGKSLYVRMEAVEKEIRATLSGKLDQVCEDSCLEFFFAPVAKDKRYFNFEFNPLGTMYLGFGAERPTRVRQIVKAPEELFQISPFRTQTGWGIGFRIPADFIRLYMPEYKMEGTCCGNFYKCGDKTRKVHYLAWAPLRSAVPDYHRRQDLGILIFK